MFHASHRLGAHSGRPWLCFSASTLRCGQRIEFVLMITGALKTESCKLYGYACSLEPPGFRILKRLWGIQSVLRLSESRAKETIFFKKENFVARTRVLVLSIVCARKPSCAALKIIAFTANRLTLDGQIINLVLYTRPCTIYGRVTVFGSYFLPCFLQRNQCCLHWSWMANTAGLRALLTLHRQRSQARQRQRR